MRIKISVTQKHINRGKRCSICNCPVALALQEAFKPKRKRDVYSGIYSLHINGKRIPHSKATTKRIERFDETGEMKPFNFYINYSLDEKKKS